MKNKIKPINTKEGTEQRDKARKYLFERRYTIIGEIVENVSELIDLRDLNKIRDFVNNLLYVEDDGSVAKKVKELK